MYEIGNSDHRRWRVFCKLKQTIRGHLDRTVTATTLAKLYRAALAAGAREVALV